MEETVSLDEIFQLLKKKLALIISMLILGTIISTVVTLFVITPKYSATTQLVVQTKGSDSNINTDKINSNLLLINTYKDLVKSKVVTEKAKDQLVKDGMTGISEDFLSHAISVEQNQNSQLFSIKAVTTDPIKSATIANTVSEIFQQEAVVMTDTDKVSIASKAIPNNQPISPNKKVNIAIGAVLGLIVGVMLALLSELFNRTVKTEDYLSEKLGLPVLGIIPLMSDREMNEIRKLQSNAFVNEEMFFEVNDLYKESLNTEVDGLDADLYRARFESNDEISD
ncbi:Wzz/FepE/Etk N-terminal domain-containing protein [Vagococcus sp. CY53-2]|uniref:YveK family protein n=1 Tax=Vagococcus sp. CY53-2 TaxID=2925780 RepID=UPI001F50F249|nr:Wzz/FepE/Etk N-terminal domain-containing protein [Vagococcus sp. CY53-2]MCI0130532.1 Wzz/FepE/Etk N-terminal domain-containing protein [Vagococcus sp. CY53-2]